MGDSKGGVVAIGVVFLILPVIAALLRFWARSIVRAKLGVNDYLIFPALAFSTVAGIAMIICACIGNLGTHGSPPVAPDGTFIHTAVYRNYNLSKWFLQVFATLTIGTTKLSVLFLYRKIFSVAVFRKITAIAIAIILSWTVSFTIGLILQCIPVSAFWDYFEWEAPKYCFQQVPFYLALTISDIITDVGILLLPIPMVWQLHLPIRQRIAVGGMFLLGAVVCAAGFVRLAFFFTLQLAVLDYTYNETPTVYWTYIEASIAIVGACLPTLRPIFVRNATTDSRVFKIGSHTSRLIPRPGLMESWDSPRTRFNPGDDSSVSYLGDRSFGIETRVEPVPLESMSYPQKGIQVQREVVNKKETARRG